MEIVAKAAQGIAHAMRRLQAGTRHRGSSASNACALCGQTAGPDILPAPGNAAMPNDSGLRKEVPGFAGGQAGLAPLPCFWGPPPPRLRQGFGPSARGASRRAFPAGGPCGVI